ncbi:SDR family oxidoreductase [Litchfieldella xinjiangensis]|uniref:SDR family oxidoreductase n=1 Tax=Litchfieldella xinjiangensis TaxID=1166948 RepID=UPI0005BAD8AA|nr:SDR family oxidoreductase [Halomonas xinjiangensis]
MDLGIAGRWAIVCAASKGLGKGCAKALAKEGVNLVINARGQDALEGTANELRALNASIEVIAIAGDISTPDIQEAVLSACPHVDILVNNNGGPPPGDFRDWDRDDWFKAVEGNMVTPIELIKATVDKMAANGFGRVVNITSGAVKAPIDILGLSNGARSGLTGFIAGLARQPELASNNVTINNLLPGSFDTERLQGNLRKTADKTGTSVEALREQRVQGIPARRFGNADEFGDVCAFLCSAQASYLTGQNILLDGGSYPGTF